MGTASFIGVYRGSAKLVYLACVLGLAGCAAGAPFFDARADDYSEAKSLLAKRRWSEALPTLERLAREAPASVLIRTDLATTYLRLNERARAIATLNAGRLAKQARTAATAFVTEEGLKRYEEGLTLLTQGKPKQSIEKFERAQALERDHLEILTRLAENEILLADDVDARKWLVRIEEVYGLSGETLYWKSVADLRADPSAFAPALPRLEALARDFPESASVTLLRVDALYELGRRADAIATLDGLERATSKSPVLLPIRAALVAENPMEAFERVTFEREAKDLVARLEKEPDVFRLKASEWGTRLYSAEALQKRLKRAIEKPNPGPSASTY